MPRPSRSSSGGPSRPLRASGNAGEQGARALVADCRAGPEVRYHGSARHLGEPQRDWPTTPGAAPGVIDKPRWAG